MLARSSSRMSMPMELLAASKMARAVASASSSPADSSSCSAGTASSRSAARSPTACATRAYTKLSLTMRASSGKCQPYHSRTRMAKVFKSLSSVSISAIACKKERAWGGARGGARAAATAAADARALADGPRALPSEAHLNDHVVGAVDVELDLGARVRVRQAQRRARARAALERRQKVLNVQPHAAQQLGHAAREMGAERGNARERG